jgi:transcriptional regulator with XRE-family HTH domain
MLNKTEFAKLLEIDFRQYSRYENGVVPTSESMLRIAQKLNKKVEDIFYLAD